jgi:hypothetical protein
MRSCGHPSHVDGHDSRARAPVTARLAIVAVLLGAPAAWGHKPSDSYLTLRPHGAGLEGRWDIDVRDLDHALVLDGDGDGAVTWGEVRGREQVITAYALQSLALAAPSGPCTVLARPLETVAHSDGLYLSLPLQVRCPEAAQRLTVDYRLFAGLDPQHRGIVHIDDESGSTVVVAPGDGPRAVPIAASPPRALSFLVEGVQHIWAGLDHVLFLIALLLPSVVRRQGGLWAPVPAIRSALGDVAKIVTAFTVAHSLTLSLAALGLVSVSARVIEPAIAASVALAAINNVRPVFGPDRWVVAFALGLLHGFGFSSVLADAGLAPGALARALVGFNLGVEVGQLGIVALFVPAAFFLRRTAAYRRVALLGGSAAIAAVAVLWTVQRIATG